MTVREDGDVTVQNSESSYQLICAVGNFGGLLAARTSVSKNIPVWPDFADIDWALPLVVAVVPLTEVGFDLRTFSQTCQLTCSPCSLQWAGEHVVEAHGMELFC